MRINMKELSTQNCKLQEQQKILRVQYDQVSNDLQKFKSKSRVLINLDTDGILKQIHSL